MTTECTNIRFFKVTELPATGVPDSIYLLLEGGFVRQYVTDSFGTIVSAPALIETLTNLSKSGNNLIYTAEDTTQTIIPFASVAFSGAYNDLVGTPTNTSSFTNDGEDGSSPYATIADIPTDVGDLTLNFDIGSSIRFNISDPTTLELVDRNDVVISNVSITPINIAGLSSYTGLDIRYYTEAELDDFFAGNTPITGYNKVQWDEAYSWGDHSTAGYLTSFNETDPIFQASPAASILNSQITNWDIAYSWGDHRVAGYLTEFIETDPLFQLSAAFGIDSLDIARWDNAITSHLDLTNIGTNTHIQIDSHIADTSIHFTSITGLSDVFTSMVPADGQVLTYDTTNGWQAETIPAGVTDHTLLTNIGVNTHAQIDTHISDATIHFTQAAISITESQISDLGTYLPLTGGTLTGDVFLGSGVSIESTGPNASFSLLSPSSDRRSEWVWISNDVLSLSNFTGNLAPGNPEQLSVSFTTGEWSIGTNKILTEADGVFGDYLPLAGGTMTGQIVSTNIIPDGDATRSLGVNGTAYATVYGYNYHFQSNIVADIDWIVYPNETGGGLSFAAETGSGTNTFTDRYTLNDSGTPTNGTDLITKTYADANYDGAGTYLPLAGGTMSGIIDMNVSGIDNVGFLDIEGNPNNLLKMQNSGTSGAAFGVGYGGMYFVDNGVRFGWSDGVTSTTNNLELNLSNLTTVGRVLTVPDASGTIALTSGIPDNTDYVDLTTNQTVGGTKTFTAEILADDYIQMAAIVGATKLAGYSNISFDANDHLRVVGSALNDRYIFASANTAERTYTLQDASGTLAFTSDVPDNTDYVDLTTNQTVGGVKTFENIIVQDDLPITPRVGNIVSSSQGLLYFKTDNTFNIALPTGVSFDQLSIAGIDLFTAKRTLTVQDADGTIALISDIPAGAGDNIYNTNGSLTGARTVTMGTNELQWSGTGGIIYMNSGRLGVQVPVFGGSRLGDNELQAKNIDTQSILFKNNAQATVGSLFMNPAFDTFTIKNFNGEDNFIEVTANDLDDTNAARSGNLELGLTLNYIDTGLSSIKLFNNDVGTTPGDIGDKMGLLFQTDGTFQSDKEVWIGRFDGTTYTQVLGIATNEVFEIYQPTTVYGSISASADGSWNIGSDLLRFNNIYQNKSFVEEIWYTPTDLEPSSPSQGQTYYDNSEDTIRLWNGASWESLAKLGDIPGAGTDYVSKTGGGTFDADISVPDEFYDEAAWNASLEVPTKNAIRDKLEGLNTEFVTLSSSTQTVLGKKQFNDIVINNEIEFIPRPGGFIDPTNAAFYYNGTTDAWGLSGPGTSVNIANLNGIDSFTAARTFTFPDASGTIALTSDLVGLGSIGGSITDNQIAVGAATADDIEGSAELTYDSTNATLALNANQTTQFQKSLDIFVPDLGAFTGAAGAWAQITFGRAASTRNSAEFSFVYDSLGSTTNYFSLGLYNTQVLELHGDLSQHWLGDVIYLEGTGDAIEFQALGAPSVLIDATDTTAGDPAIFGMSNMNSLTEGARWQFGDSYNTIENQYNQGIVVHSYHTLVLDAGHESLTDVDYTSGLFSTDVTESLRILQIHDRGMVIKDRTATARTENHLEFQTSVGTVLSGVGTDGSLFTVDEVYGIGWDGSLEVPTKNAIYDKIETLGAGASFGGEWRFDTGITATPASGDLRYNNATPASVTNLYVSSTTNGGFVADAILGVFKNGDLLYIQQDDDEAKYLLVNINGTPTDNVGDWTIPVTVEESGTLPDNNARLKMLWVQSGSATYLPLTGGTLTGDLIIDNGATQENLLLENGFIGARNDGNTWKTLLGNSSTTNNFLVGGSTTGSANTLDTYIRIRPLASGQLEFTENATNHDILHSGYTGAQDFTTGGSFIADQFTTSGDTSTSDANNFDTEGRTAGNFSIWTTSNTTASTNFPSSFGNTLWVKGSGDDRTFALWKNHTAGDVSEFSVGALTAGAWNWYRIANEQTNTFTVDGVASNVNWTLRSQADVTLTLEADTDNVTESDNPKLVLSQDGALISTTFGIEGAAGTAFTGSLDNAAYINTLRTSDDIQFAVGSTLAMTLNDAQTIIEDFLIIDNASANGNPLRIDGSGVGNANINYISLYESNGSTREGYIGFPSSGNSHMYLYNDNSAASIYIHGTTGDLHTSADIRPNNDVILTTSSNVELGTTGAITRTAHNSGYLEGSYNSVAANGAQTNPIYTIGSSYVPAATTLGNMYGIGYSNGAQTSFLNSTDLGTTPATAWGLYIAADGNARIFLNATSGVTRQLGISYASNFTLNSDRRRKNSITDYKPKDLGIRWRNFELNSEKGQYRVGVIAQELLETAPELVNQEDPDNYTVNNFDLLNAAMAQKDQEIEYLTKRLERLEELILNK